MGGFIMEVHRGISTVVLGGSPSLGLKLFSLNQCSVHGEVLPTAGPTGPLPVPLLEQGLAHPMLQEPLPVLGEGGGIKAGLNQVLMSLTAISSEAALESGPGPR